MRSKLVALIKKDLLSELRTKETLLLHLALSLTLSVMVSFGIRTAFLPHSTILQLFPLFLWLIFLFSATVSITRVVEYEYRLGALSGVLLTGVAPELVFLSKTIVTFFLTLAVHLLTFIFLGMLLDIPIFSLFLPFALLSLLVITGYAVLTVLLANITATSSLRGMLLPVVLLPLLFPLLFAALELSAVVMQDLSVPWGSSWSSVLFGFNIIYIALCPSLFAYVVTE